MSNLDWINDLINDHDVPTMSDKQRKILEAAIDTFSEKGYAASSTSEIAKKAGVAEGTIFRHFNTKKELLLAIVTPTVAKFVAPFFIKSFTKEVFENEYEHYEDFIRVIAKNRLEFVRKQFPVLKIFIQEIAFHDELREPFQKLFTEHVYQKFKKIIEHFQEKGEIVSLPPETIMRMTASSIIGYILPRFLLFSDKEWDDEKEIDQIVAFIMYGLTGKR
ncbi:TetR/AcrR family transcriptional regulator [Fictibacillus sp. 7GRE50]|jgi:AcrR family transcriptional regulator|uniref:TetR/AcrR family transcriptional regulator n=1 Tax=unclassified Fictibacillus TaxID=2644029 RepID=UPI0018CD4C98|nr:MULTISPECIES: TetR/AcrR family transcriptional regulator [unclassified Fictibacillus]MBH0164825.1 TetR/AcrR family transcriptional regulator [Fictibacillus sp. 7GRE50]MBH0172576.1 TetR/AcrR family transcriptional regulator [Fictibacillus sp. 23RED33]